MLERVFIVDEDVQARDFLYGVISEVGFNVLTLPNGKSALEFLEKERPCFIIIDDAQGEYSGLSLAKKIRQFDKDIRIIMMGQAPQPEAQDPKIKEIDIAYLKKDFQDPETIKNILTVLKEKIAVKFETGKRWGKVLVVDDEADCRKTVGNFLSRRGFEVETASCGEECLEKVKMTAFDIVLLDIALGGMDGLLTLKYILEINSQTKVVMASAMQNEEVLKEAKAIGACGFIAKPFNFGELESTIISILLIKKEDKKSQ